VCTIERYVSDYGQETVSVVVSVAWNVRKDVAGLGRRTHNGGDGICCVEVVDIFRVGRKVPKY
jgi:hypothetical protein